MIIEVSPKNALFLESLSSTRINIIHLLNNRSYNIKELAEILELSPPIVTRHVTRLNEVGIVKFESISGKRGIQKICSLALDEITLKFKVKDHDLNQYRVSIPIGQYIAYEVAPTCGLSTHSEIIGEVDKPKYFADPQHVYANHVWFTDGYVDYRIPNYIKDKNRMKSIKISFEIGSEAPRFNDDCPSAISFSLNGIHIGDWISPGDYGKNKGIYTPSWWAGSQYGLLKTLIINESGSYIDDIKISDINVYDLMIKDEHEIIFKIASLKSLSDKAHGVNLFGKKFGNHNQDIEVLIIYEETS